MFLYHYLKEWRKNPRWSFSCCLALLLPFNDLQGEIRGFADTNVFKSQLQTEQIEMPTILASVKDSGAMDVPFEEGQQDDDNTVAILACKDDTKYKCHKGIQTEIFKFSIGRMENETG